MNYGFVLQRVFSQRSERVKGLDIHPTEPRSAASEPVPATLTPTQEAHEILGAKGKNQTEAMAAAKQKRAAKRAARAEQATPDDPVAVEEALVI